MWNTHGGISYTLKHNISNCSGLTLDLHKHEVSWDNCFLSHDRSVAFDWLITQEGVTNSSHLLLTCRLLLKRVTPWSTPPATVGVITNTQISI